MTLKTLFENVKYKTNIDMNLEIKNIQRDSRNIKSGDLFFAISGTKTDGHDYIKQAIEQNVTAIVVEKDMGIDNQIIVKNTADAYGIVCGNFYDNPSKKLKLIGVTGTNGKTTVSYIVKNILENNGKKVGLIGTIENVINNISLQSKYTTPDPWELHSLFKRMHQAGCEYVVMEVSSHALDQKRLSGVTFEAGAFTNLSQDHLDYHETMEAYFEAKSKLFKISKKSVINFDDKYGKILIDKLKDKVFTFSLKDSKADFFADDINFSHKGSSFLSHNKTSDIYTNIAQPGKFSVYNALTAIGLCVASGMSFADSLKGLENSISVPGRFELICANDKYTIIRDFAHSPDGLENLLSTVRNLVQGRLITLFGCAGERDRSKRSVMTNVVDKYSDFSILTSDNPRNEKISQINSDASVGYSEDSNYKIFEDRFEAIKWAVNQLEQDDYLVLVGKGHEDYQVLDFGSINFNEKEIVLNLLKNK